MNAAASSLDGLRPNEAVDGRFRVKQELGSGNMANVYLANELDSGRAVALKVMKRRLMDRPDRLQRFDNEFTLCCRVEKHENVIAMLGRGKVEGSTGAPYLVMECVEGPSLDLLLAVQRHLAPPRAASIMLGVAEGLSAVHRAGVVHRDVKPSNIVVAQLDEPTREVPKLLDFGLAVAQAEPGRPLPRLTLHGQVAGSAGYIAPELVEGVQPHTSMDVFALGIVLAELLSGTHPYEGMARDAYLAEVGRADWSFPMDSLGAAIPEPLSTLVHACTQRDPSRRPSIDAVVDFLRAFVGGPPSPDDSASATRPAMLEAEVAEGAKGNRLGWTLAVALVMVMGTVALLGVVLGELTGDPATLSDATGVPSLSGHSASTTDAIDPASDESATDDDSESTDTTGANALSSTGDDGASTGEEPSAARSHAPVRRRPRPAGGRPSPRPEPGPPVPAPELPPQKADPGSEQCELVRSAIVPMCANGRWSRLLFMLKDSRACLSEAEYRRLRVEALAGLGRWRECLHAAGTSNDPKLTQWVQQCKAQDKE